MGAVPNSGVTYDPVRNTITIRTAYGDNPAIDKQQTYAITVELWSLDGVSTQLSPITIGVTTPTRRWTA